MRDIELEVEWDRIEVLWEEGVGIEDAKIAVLTIKKALLVDNRKLLDNCNGFVVGNELLICSI